jgi:hypothetical protein
MRRRLPILVLFGLAAMAAVALAQVGKAPRAGAVTIATSGSFEISDSHEGLPIFAATGIAPGEAAQGTVTIEDPGSEPVALRLHRGELTDVPAVGGGALSGQLRLSVVDVTEPGVPRTVYSGPLASMPDQHVGDLEAGEARTYEFAATLPEGPPTVQNAVQGAATNVAYSWVATEVSEPEEPMKPEEENGEPPVERKAEPSPSSGGNGGGQYVVEAAPGNGTLGLTVPKIRRFLSGARLVVWVGCDKACRLYVRGRMRATAAGTHRTVRIRLTRQGLLAPGVHRLRIPVPRALRRWMSEQPGRERLRARLRFVAVGTDGERDVVRTTTQLRARGG